MEDIYRLVGRTKESIWESTMEREMKKEEGGNHGVQESGERSNG